MWTLVARHISQYGLSAYYFSYCLGIDGARRGQRPSLAVPRSRVCVVIVLIACFSVQTPALDRESLLPLASNTGTVTKRNRLAFNSSFSFNKTQSWYVAGLVSYLKCLWLKVSRLYVFCASELLWSATNE